MMCFYRGQQSYPPRQKLTLPQLQKLWLSSKPSLRNLRPIWGSQDLKRVNQTLIMSNRLPPNQIRPIQDQTIPMMSIDTLSHLNLNSSPKSLTFLDSQTVTIENSSEKSILPYSLHEQISKGKFMKLAFLNPMGNVLKSLKTNPNKKFGTGSNSFWLSPITDGELPFKLEQQLRQCTRITLTLPYLLQPKLTLRLLGGASSNSQDNSPLPVINGINQNQIQENLTQNNIRTPDAITNHHNNIIHTVLPHRTIEINDLPDIFPPSPGFSTKSYKRTTTSVLKFIPTITIRGAKDPRSRPSSISNVNLSILPTWEKDYWETDPFLLQQWNTQSGPNQAHEDILKTFFDKQRPTTIDALIQDLNLSDYDWETLPDIDLLEETNVDPCYHPDDSDLRKCPLCNPLFLMPEPETHILPIAPIVPINDQLLRNIEQDNMYAEQDPNYIPLYSSFIRAVAHMELFNINAPEAEVIPMVPTANDIREIHDHNPNRVFLENYDNTNQSSSVSTISQDQHLPMWDDDPLLLRALLDIEYEEEMIRAAERILQAMPLSYHTNESEFTSNKDESETELWSVPNQFTAGCDLAPPIVNKLPQVKWDIFAKTFMCSNTQPFQNILIFSNKKFAINKAKTPADQVDIIKQIIPKMVKEGIITRTNRGPYRGRLFLIPKGSKGKSRLICDLSHLTPTLHKPKMRLPPPTIFLQWKPLPPEAFFVTIDLQDAFYHLTLHPQAKFLTTFRFQGKYYHYNVLPFGLRTAPFIMQNFLNFLIRHLRRQSLWVWGHIDNLLIAHADKDFLTLIITNFIVQLTDCGIIINQKKCSLHPLQKIETLGFIFNSNENALYLSYRRRTACYKMIDCFQNRRLPKTTKEAFLGYIAYSFTVQGRPFFLLRHLYQSIYKPSAYIPNNIFFLLKDWFSRTSAGTPLYPIPTGEIWYSDATNTSIAVTHNTNQWAVRVPYSPIYKSELLALLWATELAPSFAIIKCDNEGLVKFTHFFRTTTAPIAMNHLYKLFLNIYAKQLNIVWVSTTNNLADYPSRCVNIE